MIHLSLAMFRRIGCLPFAFAIRKLPIRILLSGGLAILMQSVSVVADGNPHSTAQRANTTTQAGSTALEVVEVYGQRTVFGALDVDLKNYSGFETYIDRQVFANRLIDVGQIINGTASAQTTSGGGIGAYSAVSIRGSSNQQVNVYLDGVLMNNPQSGGADFSSFPTSIIERIEVYPDITPLELYSANIGGAVNIVTRRPAHSIQTQGNDPVRDPSQHASHSSPALKNIPIEGNINTSVGSFGARAAELSVWGAHQKTTGLLAASFIRADNDYPFDRDAICTITCGRSNKRQNAGYQQSALLLKASRALTSTQTLAVTTRLSRDKRQLPTAANKARNNAYLDNDTHNLALVWQGGEKFPWGIQYGFGRYSAEFHDPRGFLSEVGERVKQTLHTHSVNSFIKHQLGKHHVSAGLSLTLDQSRKLNLSADSRTNDREFISERDLVTVSLADHWQLTKNFSWSMIGRATDVKETSSRPETLSFNRSRCRSDKPECAKRDSHYQSIQTGISYKIESWQFKANTGKGIRTPTLTERFGELGRFSGNAELMAESSRFIDMGFQIDRASWFLESVIFRKHIENGIQTLFDSSGAAAAKNVNEAQVQGIEGNLIWLINSIFNVKAGMQWLDSKNLNGLKDRRNKQLAGIYHESASLTLNTTWRSHTLNLTGQLENRLYFAPNNKQAADPRALMSVHYGFQKNAWTFNLQLLNALDRQYRDFSFMPGQGRSVSATFGFDF